MFRTACCIFCKGFSFIRPNSRPGDWEYNFVGSKKKGEYIWYHKSCYLKHLAEQRQERESKENYDNIK